MDDRPKPRVSKRLAVTLSFEGSGIVEDGVVENISETGVLVRTTTKQPVGAIAQIDFGEFEAKGEVIWSEESDDGTLLGMRLVSMGWDGWKTIRGFFETAEEEGA